MRILQRKRLVRFWVSPAEDYKEPEEAFIKVTGDKVGFEDYFRNKLLLVLFNVSKTDFTLNSRENRR